MTCRVDVGEAARVRHWITGIVKGWGFEPDDVTLLTSEVVTNAIVHGRTSFEVCVALVDGRVRVEVIDSNPRLPLAAAVPPGATSGRGLGLVERLSSAWGVEPRRAGKAVWFEVARS